MSPDAQTPRPEHDEPVRRPTLGDRVSLWLANLAKLRRRHLRSTTEDAQDFYESFFADKDYEGWRRDGRRNVRRATIADYFSAHVAEGSTVFDAGCGFGEVLSGLSSDFQLVGMDFSYANLRVARDILKERGAVVQGSGCDVPLRSGSVDVCMCLEVLEHIADDRRAVGEIVRVLKPGGVLIAAVPSTYYWPEYRQLIGHFRHYTRASFCRMLTDAGLTVTDYLPNYPHWHLAYSRRYCWARFLSMTLGRLTGKRDVFEVKWPWCSETVMAKAEARLQGVMEKDARLDYSSMESSTFVVARKES